MLKRSVLLVVTVAILTATANAGEIKIHTWPTQYIPQEVCTIRVLMDIGYWIEIVNQNDPLKLQQTAIDVYEGCLDLGVKCNFACRLSCTIVPTGAVQGTYSCYLTGADIDPPAGIATLCARVDNAQLIGQPGGTDNVHVASVTISVVPRIAY